MPLFHGGGYVLSLVHAYLGLKWYYHILFLYSIGEGPFFQPLFYMK